MAQAHINALLATPNSLRNERILLMHKPYWFREVMYKLNDHFYDKGLTKIATYEVGTKVLSIASLIDSQAALVL